MNKLMGSYKKLSIASQKCGNVNDDAAADDDDADGDMIPMCRPCFAGDSKSGYVYMAKGHQCNKYIQGTFATIKKYLLSLYLVRVLGPFRISHTKLGPLSRENLTLSLVNNKGTDQSAHPASLMRAFVICSLESIIAKQLNLAHSKSKLLSSLCE